MEANIVEFSHFLGSRGLKATTTQVLAGVRAADIVGTMSPRDLKNALRAAFTVEQEHFAAFSRLFNEFFLAPEDQPEMLDCSPCAPESQPIGLGVCESDDEPAPSQAAPASALEVLGRTAFTRLDRSQAELMAREVTALLEPLARRLSRRRRPGGRRELAWRATMRGSLAAGGELAALKYNQRARRRRRLVVLADVSGSMELSTPYIFHFLKGLASAWRRVEVFVFATRLTRITAWLAKNSAQRLPRELPRLVPDLAGGTRLGEALQALFRGYAGYIGPSTVSFIVSDGWDRGDQALLSREMARLHRQSFRVIWLNPLLESPRYQPINRGMAAALPYVDHFLSCHNLQSLQKAARILERLIK